MTLINRSSLTRRVSFMAFASCIAAVGFALSSCSPATTDATANASYEQQLANHLTESDATMYGAFWCPHCTDQKDLFGEAISSVPYVECDPEGENAQPQLCASKDIQGYPTWEIDGELYPGTRSLDELAELSGFEADQADQ